MGEEVCPRCGAKLKFRLGDYECPDCGHVEYFMDSVGDPQVNASINRQPLAMQVEKWLLFATGLALYAAGSVFAAALVNYVFKPSSPTYGMEGLYLIAMWSWFPTMVLSRLSENPYIGAAIAMLLVAGVQYLVLFRPDAELKYGGLVFASVFTLWWAVLAISAVVVHAPDNLALACLIPIVVGAWGCSLLIRDIRWLRASASGGL